MSAVDCSDDGPMIPSGPSGTGFAEPASRVVELAAHYLERVARGEEPDLEVIAGALPEELLREQFRRLIGDARSVQDLLPVQIQPGMILSGRYRVGAQIGSGGMGRVYEAFDRQLERPVALKVLAMPGATSFDAQRQFRREAVLLAGLQHPNIVAVHEIAVEGDVNYIVMDLVKGTPLDEVIDGARRIVKQAGATPGRRAGLLREILEAAGAPGEAGPVGESDWHRAVARVLRGAAFTLEAAHAAGVVHRDVKPKNVMLRSNGVPVLLDFGLAAACEAGSGDMTQGLFGTTSYLAPEQASSGHVGNDPRSDVYQLGVLLHELLTLTRPFDGAGPAELIRKISNGTCRRPREIDASIPFDLEAICLRAMEIVPANRYQSARALREDLDRWLGGIELPLAAGGGRFGRFVRGSRYAIRRHKVLAAAGLALLAGAVIGALSWVGGRADAKEIQAYRFRPGTAETVLDPGIGAVSPGDQLGVVINTPEPLYVYVVSVSGESKQPRWVAPMSLVLNKFEPRTDDGLLPSYHAFLGTTQTGVRLPAGSTQIVCTQIGRYDPDNPYEGLWVFTSREPHASLEAWLDLVDSEARRDVERKAVSYDTARRLFADVGSISRGGSPPRPTLQQARTMADSLTAAMLLGESDWPFDDPKRWSAVWPVQQP